MFFFFSSATDICYYEGHTYTLDSEWNPTPCMTYTCMGNGLITKTVESCVLEVPPDLTKCTLEEDGHCCGYWNCR